jgi:hypothetical protein
MYVERHHRGLPVALRRLTDNLREQRAMASVYAIEETNRGNLAHGWHFRRNKSFCYIDYLRFFMHL